MTEALNVVAAYAALVLSGLLAVVAGVRSARDRSDKRIEQLQEQVATIRGCSQRLEGANLLERLNTLETRQRADETALVRVEERLLSVDRSLGLLLEEIRRDGRVG